jgi:hypothetical protein
MSDKKYKLDYENKVILGSCYQGKYGQLTINFAGGKLEFSKAKSGRWYAYYIPSIADEGKAQTRTGQPEEFDDSEVESVESDSVPF